jgi:signal transduction histidine kinase/ligand-binding sensor domain-containing protein
VLFVLLPAVTAPAAAPHDSLTGKPSYTLTAWTRQGDLSLGDVFAIAEDRDGYLWLGTSNGLVRFDGAVFTRRATGAPTRTTEGPVTALLGASDGSLWVGYGGAGGLVRMHAGELAHFGPGSGPLPGSIAALVEDRTGTIWAGGRGGVSAFRHGRWEPVEVTPALSDGTVYSIYEDRDGRLWLGTSKGVYASAHHGFELSLAEPTFVQDFAQDRHGQMWITDTRETIKRLATGEGPIHGAGARVPEGGWRMASDRDGNLWVAALGGGLLRVVDDASGASALERFPYEHKVSGSPRSIFADRNGNIWVGMRAGGLLRVSENSIRNELALEGLTNDGVRAVRASPDGSVWVATGHSLNRFIGTRRDVYGVPQTRALEVDASGQLWIAAVHGFGRLENGRFIGIELPADVRWQEIMSVATDPGGAHWFCSAQQGVMVWHNGTLERFTDEPRMGNACSAIFTDSRARPWIGFGAGGVAVHEAGSFHYFGEADGLAEGAVLQILEDRANSIWIETVSGISRFQDGRFTTLTQRNGPFSDLTAALIQDDEGYLWTGVSSGAALVRFPPSEMDRVAADPFHEVQYALYDASDGLHGEIARQQGRALATRAADGSLWFVSGTSIVMIDPRRLPGNQRPVAPRIDAVTADGTAMAAAPGLRLPSGVRNLAIEWTASSLNAASKLRFRYRLEGYDPEWVYAGSRRNVSYSQLPAGRYRLKVSATYDGIWTDGESWDFAVAQPFYLSAWFLALGGLMMTAVVAGAWWLRIRAVRQRYALVFAERALVSREIHDTLLQNLAAIGMELEAVVRQLDPRSSGAEALRRLQHQAAHSMKEARDLVVALRRTEMSKAPGLVDTLRGMFDHTTAARGVSVNLKVDGPAPRCSADVELQLMRICQEAVNNAVVHGGASAIDIVLASRGTEIALRVSDNGCGFDADAEPADGLEHLGLLGMQERAERIGALLTISSTRGTGTVVEVTAPVDGN